MSTLTSEQLHQVVSLADERVQNGVRLLDQNAPGWREKVNGQAVRIESDVCCVLGQVYGHYADGCEALNFNGQIGTPVQYGFNSDLNVGIAELNEAWKKALAS